MRLCINVSCANCPLVSVNYILPYDLNAISATIAISTIATNGLLSSPVNVSMGEYIIC